MILTGGCDCDCDGLPRRLTMYAYGGIVGIELTKGLQWNDRFNQPYTFLKRTPQPQLKTHHRSKTPVISHRHTFTDYSEGPQTHKDNPPSQTYALYSQPNSTLSYPVPTSYRSYPRIHPSSFLSKYVLYPSTPIPFP
jgi:hypothetical protein